MNQEKIGILCIPKSGFKSIIHNKEFFKEVNNTEVKYIKNTFNIDAPMATIQIGDKYFVVPAKWITNPIEDMIKSLNNNYVFVHKSGFKIINSGLGIGVKTDDTAKSWACSMMGLVGFLEYTKTRVQDYTKLPKIIHKKGNK